MNQKQMFNLNATTFTELATVERSWYEIEKTAEFFKLSKLR